jgi:hypothetical protein
MMDDIIYRDTSTDKLYSAWAWKAGQKCKQCDLQGSSLGCKRIVLRMYPKGASVNNLCIGSFKEVDPLYAALLEAKEADDGNN